MGGLTYGVAKNVTLWAVRAMNCDGDAKVSSILEVRRGAVLCAVLCAPVACWGACKGATWLLTRGAVWEGWSAGVNLHLRAAAAGHLARLPFPAIHPKGRTHRTPAAALSLQAFEWIAENAQFPAVVSMSVAGDMSPTVNEAARRLVQDRDIPMVGAGAARLSLAFQ